MLDPVFITNPPLMLVLPDKTSPKLLPLRHILFASPLSSLHDDYTLPEFPQGFYYPVDVRYIPVCVFLIPCPSSYLERHSVYSVQIQPPNRNCRSSYVLQGSNRSYTPPWLWL